MLKKVINLFFNSTRNLKKRQKLKKENVFVHPSSLYDRVFFGKNIKVGRQSYIYNTTISSYSYLAGFNTVLNTHIGKFCSIAENVAICTGKHPTSIFVSTSPAFYSLHQQCGISFADKQYFDEMGSVHIGNDVWIGGHSVIMDDVTIGNGAIIAANSVVNTDIPPYAIYGGTPAKLIKFRFSETDIKFLEGLKWWNKDENWLEENVLLMHDIEKLKARFC